MDENKEQLTPNVEANNDEITNTDTVNATEILNNPDSYDSLTGILSDDFSETENNPDEEPFDDDESSFVPTLPSGPSYRKKKSVLQFPIIVAVAIVAVTALALLTVKCFFNTSVVGTWVYSVSTSSDSASEDEASSDEASTVDVYYTFKDDGTCEYRVGSVVTILYYTASVDDDGNNTLALGSSYSSQSSLYYSVSGNVFTGRTLILGSTTELSEDLSSVNVLKSGTVPDLGLTSAEDFEPNDDLTGTWSYENDYGYLMSYTFNDEGKVVINQADTIYVYGVYTYTDNEITVEYCYPDKMEMVITYSVDDGGLVLNDILYTKDTGDGTASADSAD